ncbi:mini-chromosome maintenance complex-binding protein isoform X1 [Onthophagus taurus]|uniref:mini-chromosome maintenance complex-binding protein isoform X1 n=2 Tax=Onthophagus taurus TaxID=166361 RepID=UPI0039BDB407
MDLRGCSLKYFMENEEVCLNYIKNNLDQIPYLNAISMDGLKDGALVRFRGMVQDMRSCEYYLDKYEIKKKDTGEVTYKSGRYQDIIECNDNEMINQFSNRNKTSERHPLVLISVPGLNNWVTDIEITKYGNDVEPSLEVTKANTKRKSLESTEEMEQSSSHSTENESKQIKNDTESSKKLCDESVKESLPTQSNQPLSAEYLLNLPLPDRGGKVCIVKIYEEEIDIKVNEILDVVGFISLDPRMTQTSLENSLFDCEETEILAHHPPPSLIPRIQVVHWSRTHHVNPLFHTEIDLSMEKATMLCTELKMIFTEILFGDSLAGSYLFYHLISTVYLRKNLAVLGKFTLNFSNIPQSLVSEFGKNLYEIIELLVTHSHYLPMTLDNMNELPFIPKKDVDANRLNSSVLQLAPNTHLILDETQMSPGRLNSSGCQAIAALNRLIKDQEISYDFKVYNVDFCHNIPILIVSEGKSMLPSDYHVILQPNNVHVETYSEVFPAAKLLLTQELLNDLRQYLTLSKHKKHELPQDIECLIEEDFVKYRREYDINAQDLHQLLDLARLVAFGDGKSTIDKNSWKSACKLEEERWLRIRGL